MGEHDVWAILHAAALVYGSGGQHIYHVFLPKGMDTCLDVSDPGHCYSPDNPSDFWFCGYHAAVLFGDIGVVLYTMVPYQNVLYCQEAPPNPNGIVADSTNGTLGHEVFETITDPLGNAWTNEKMDVLYGAEIADECELWLDSFFQFPDPVFKLNGKLYQTQLVYSNRGHICAHEPQ